MSYRWIALTLETSASNCEAERPAWRFRQTEMELIPGQAGDFPRSAVFRYGTAPCQCIFASYKWKSSEAWTKEIRIKILPDPVQFEN